MKTVNLLQERALYTFGSYPTVNYFSIDRERFSPPFIASNPMIYNAAGIHTYCLLYSDSVSFLSLQQLGDKCFSNKLPIIVKKYHYRHDN